MSDTLPTVRMYCCRAWDIFPLAPVGRCGYCGERPRPRD